MFQKPASNLMCACAACCPQESALTRVSKMRDVFNRHFSLDDEGTPRTWRPQENIPSLARAARREAARVLALLVGCWAVAVLMDAHDSLPPCVMIACMCTCHPMLVLT